MAKKGGMPSYKTVDDYIANQKQEAQAILIELRSIIKDAAPDAKELADSKVPSYILVPDTKPKQHVMLMASAKCVSFYPFEAAVAHFSEELKGYDLGKGTVKFPFDQPLPIQLIKKMVLYRKEELSA